MTNSLNLLEIDQEQALNLSRFSIKAKQNIALFGRRGTGKTEIAIQAARECGLTINYVNLSVIERPDLAGYPNIFDSSDVVSFKAPKFLPLLKNGDEPNSVLLFDEVDKAPPEVTSPLLEILRTRTINGSPINAHACMLTGNLLNENSNSNEISRALLDRCSKYLLQFSFDKWLIWGRANNVHELVMGFLCQDPSYACGDVADTSYATPSPRGWVLASDALYKAREFKMHDIETVFGIVSGFVGAEAGLRFKMWYEYYRHFEPQILSLIENGIYPIDIDKLSPTELFVFCVTLCHLTRRKIVESNSKSRNLKYIETVCLFYKQNKIADELQLITIRNSFPGEFVTKHKLYESKIFLEKSKDLQTDLI